MIPTIRYLRLKSGVLRDLGGPGREWLADCFLILLCALMVLLALIAF